MTKALPRHNRIDQKHLEICLNCYLSACHLEGRLRQYCPVNAVQKYKVSPPIALQIVKATPTNRRWQFEAAMREAA